VFALLDEATELSPGVEASDVRGLGLLAGDQEGVPEAARAEVALAHEAFRMLRETVKTPAEAEAALELVRTWTTARGLTLHPTKTKIAHEDEEGFEFLGYRFIKHRRFPRQKSLAKFKETIRGKTKRTNGNSLQAIIANVNRTLRGWYEYFKHSWRTTFGDLDGWIRMRLRSILRKRAGRRGRGSGSSRADLLASARRELADGWFWLIETPALGFILLRLRWSIRSRGRGATRASRDPNLSSI